MNSQFTNRTKSHMVVFIVCPFPYLVVPSISVFVPPWVSPPAPKPQPLWSSVCASSRRSSPSQYRSQWGQNYKPAWLRSWLSYSVAKLASGTWTSTIKFLYNLSWLIMMQYWTKYIHNNSNIIFFVFLWFKLILELIDTLMILLDTFL